MSSLPTSAVRRRATGPVTPEGKARSAQNAKTHGLCAKTALLPGESPQEYEELLQAYLDEHRPSGISETRLVREMVDAEWRLRRIRIIEADLLSRHMQSPGASLAAAFDQVDTNRMFLLQRYEVQHRRQWEKALQALLELRRIRTADQQARQRQADRDFDRMLEAYIMAPPPCDPALLSAPSQQLRNELRAKAPSSTASAPLTSNSRSKTMDRRS